MCLSSETTNDYTRAFNLGLSGAYAAGGVYSTVMDLYQWHNALMKNKLLLKKSKTSMFTSCTTKRGNNTGDGYGWFVTKYNSIIEHGGRIQEFSSYMYSDIEKKGKLLF